jgi:hypothetical protein
MSRRKAIGTILAGLAMPGIALEGCVHLSERTETLERRLAQDLDPAEETEIEVNEEKQVPSVNVELDYLTSLLVSYHILCAPTEMNQKYNSDIFEELGGVITEREKEVYFSFLQEEGFSGSNSDMFRQKLFVPEYNTLDELFESNRLDMIPKKVKDRIRRFNPQFNAYWNQKLKDIEVVLEKRKKEFPRYIEKAYETSERLTGEKLDRENIKVRVIEGTAPNSFTRTIEGDKYIAAQRRNIVREKDDYALIALIHEAIPHMIGERYRMLHEEIFGEWTYRIEEGFAKLFSRKVAEEILGRKARAVKPSNRIERMSYDIFSEEWNRLDGNFAEWYKINLYKINERLSK